MPSFRKLNPDETAAADQRTLSVRAQIAQEYDAYLADLAIGDYGRAEPTQGERRNIVRSEGAPISSEVRRTAADHAEERRAVVPATNSTQHPVGPNAATADHSPLTPPHLPPPQRSGARCAI